MIARGIKNFIFDLGGVILDLDVNKTHEAFARLAHRSVDEIKEAVAQQSFFNDYEEGLLSDGEFRASLRSLLNSSVRDESLDAAWNSMLLKIPEEKYLLLQNLKSSSNLFLLSNTNAIHLEHINKLVLDDTGHPNLGHFFHTAYYSHLMKMRKPDVKIFNQVIIENNLRPEETCFIDDNLQNVTGAKAAGLQAVHLTSPHELLSLFNEYKN